jgi:methyl-accepting chemotaxis protein
MEAVIDVFESAIYEDYFEVLNVYFASNEGSMILYPDQELPEDYDARERPWFTNAIEQGIVIEELYLDDLSQRYVQSIFKSIVVNDEIIGVLGIDIFVD